MLKALVTGCGTAPAMQWSQKNNGTYKPISGANEDTLSLSGLTAGSYVYHFTYNVEGYYKSVDFTVTVEKATVQVTAAPTAVLNLVYTGENQKLILPGAADKGTMYYTIGRNGNYRTDLPTALRAGTYQVYYYASPTDRDNYIPSEPEYIEVTVVPRPVQDLTVQLLGEPFSYDGTNKTQKVKVTLGDMDVTSQIHVLGNTAAKAGSYHMTLQAAGGNLMRQTAAIQRECGSIASSGRRTVPGSGRTPPPSRRRGPPRPQLPSPRKPPSQRPPPQRPPKPGSWGRESEGKAYVPTDWLENAQTFTPWDGYAGSNCGLYASFQLTGTPEKTIYVNSKLTVLWTAGEVSLVQVDSARYYARTATLTKTPIQTTPTPEAPASEGTGEELWTPPVM